MTKPISTAKLEQATGRSFDDWLAYLEQINAKSLTHKEIAAHLVEKAGVDGWWAQSITVAYEQHAGRRRPGQRSDGTFSAAASRTLTGARDDWFRHWCKRMAKAEIIAGQRLVEPPTTTNPASGPSWRCKLADGTRVTLNMYEAAPGKTRATIEHAGLVEAAVAEVKSYWRGKLAELE